MAGSQTMTEYEIASLFDQMYNTAGVLMSSALALVSGTLVASYAAAHRLSRTMAILSVGIYAWMCFLFIVLTYRQMSIISGLFVEARAFREAGKGLDWHAAALTPAALSDVIPTAAAAFEVILFAATLLFFFHCRRPNRAAPNNPPAPEA